MLRLPRFLRRYMKRITTPMLTADANRTRRNISLLYAFIAWHGLGLLVYVLYKQQTEDRTTSGLSEGRYYAQMLKAENVQLVRVRNASIVGQWDLEEEKQKYGHLLTTEELEKINLPAEERLAEDSAVVE